MINVIEIGLCCGMTSRVTDILNHSQLSSTGLHALELAIEYRSRMVRDLPHYANALGLDQ